MVCEKYSKLIRDEALGGLSPKRGADLREHLAHCVSCRNELVRAKNLADAVTSGIGMLVAGEPSPQFASRLRARIANEPCPAQLDWRAWIPVAGGVIVLAALLLAVTIRTPRPGNRTPSLLAVSGPDAAVSAKAEKTAAGDGSHLRRSMVRAVQPQEPEVLVPPGQLAAVMQFASAMNQGLIDGEQIVVAQQESKKPLKIETIQIAPVSIPQLDDAGDTDNTGGY